MSGALADESFKLGKLAVRDVDRKWNSGSELGVLGFSSNQVEGGYSYKVKGDSVNFAGGCVSEKGDKSFSLGSGMSVGSSFAKLGCTCKGESGDPTKVVIAAGNDGKYEGELKIRTATYRVTGVYEGEGMISNGQPTGYRVDGDSPRGAVEVLKPGRVWFARGLDPKERNDLACLYVGLMLYLPPQQH